MKISLTVMIILTTSLCVLPFLWFMLIGKNTARKRKNIFKNLVKQHQFQISQKEQWNSNFIAIDDTQKMLLFIKLKPTGNEVFKINLNEVRACHVNKVTRDFKRNKKVESELQTIHLEFTFTNHKPMQILNFYDIIEEFSEEFEMKRAEKWQQVITQNILISKTNSLAA